MTGNEADPHNVLRSSSGPAQNTASSKRFLKLQKRTKTLLYRLLLLGIYTTTGAAVFHVIESGNEDEKNFCHNEGDSEVELEMAKKFNVSMKEVRKIVEDLCAMFEASHRCKYSHNDWSYYQSLYFVGSVTTTIGYGHLAPKTQPGRLFLIFFAFFGIPINLLTLQSIGEHINLCFHCLITCVEKKLFKNSTVRHEHIKTFILSVVLMILILPIGGIMYYFSEREKGWSFLDSVYYTFVALSTIGFGDLVPNEGKEPKSTYERVMWCVRLMFIGLGLSLVSSVFTSISSATKQIKSAYMSKKGKYHINQMNPNKPSYDCSTKQCFLNFKELLCNTNVENTSGNTVSPQREAYSVFEDTISTTSTSLNPSHTHVGLSNEDYVQEHVNALTNNVRYRSISMAFGPTSLGIDLDTNSCILMVDRTNSNSIHTSRDVNNSDHPTKGSDHPTKDSRTEINGAGILGNHKKTETEDPDRMNKSRDSTWTNNEMTAASNEDAIKQLDNKD
ncbi:potassium channel subfamily K member 9-like isoform X2 [Actinia tenebrosa]|nr:potassium channel subfamily K member 9-like isoform X2 [Actinia tenebrosa]